MQSVHADAQTAANRLAKGCPAAAAAALKQNKATACCVVLARVYGPHLVVLAAGGIKAQALLVQLRHARLQQQHSKKRLRLLPMQLCETQVILV